ncbi:Aralkylamine dehydrogenase light chain [BD1-7 clade bacterium]|uniref:Aralkylamine dehydrogenase light chain n=1 Tax=BD1-7 clade bacterium TaxID=2029982 RepID=A0A5S9QH32_9GAMM|nr:Aralkylamine dehydrogenase light chain [BD1-7 clade bacterium]
MVRILDMLFAFVDRRTESFTRRVAQRSSRRSFLTRSSTFILGSALLPVLPFDSGVSKAWAGSTDTSDPTSCDYWRYCAIDGNLCSECGGTITACPPGSEVSKVSWVGTCRNPADDKDYLVSYNDCCGKAECRGKTCLRNERERPGYDMGLNNDVSWCMANTSQGYHCTVVGLLSVIEPE